MSFQLFVYDDPDHLPIGQETYLASREAEGFWLQGSGAVRSSSKTLPRLWRELGDRLQAPAPLSDILWQKEVLRAAQEMPLLQALRGNSRYELFSVLRRLDSEALQLDPQSPVEEDLENLRDRLRERGIFSQESQRTWIAERAQDVSLGDIEIALLPTPSRQLGLLLEALGRRNQVRLFALLSRPMIDPYKDLLGVDILVKDFTKNRTMLFGDPGESDREIRMIHCRPEEVAALLPGRTLASPSPLSDWRRFWPAGGHLLFRVDVSARDTLRGSQLLHGLEDEIEDLSLGSSEEEMLWQEAYNQEIEATEGRPDLAEDIFAERVWRGKGSPLLFPGEVASAMPERLLFWGLSSGSYPKEATPSLLLSEDCLERYPQLGSKDQRPVFVSALLSAREEICLLRDGDSPSSFWLEAERVWGRSTEYLQAESPRSQLRSQARRAARTPDLDRLRSRLERGEPELPHNRDYSVTELESYLRCPLGWFVQYRLRPRRPASPEQEEGNELHRFLEEAFDLSPERQDRALEDMPEDRRDVLRDVLDRYGETEGASEVVLEKTWEIDGEEILLRGRADRVLFLDEGILLVDWKRGNPPRLDRSLQAALYPWMAADRFQQEPLGFMFVSLETGKESGMLTEPLREMPGGWKRWSQRAAARAEEAVQGIASGTWKKRGDRCPDWCPHHLLSGVDLD